MPNTLPNGENKTVRFEVTAGGQTLSQEKSKGLEYLFVEDHADMIGVCHATFALKGEMEWSTFKVGDDFQVKVGGSDYIVFKGVITELRHSWTNGHEGLTLVALDPLCKLASSRRTKTWNDMTDSSIAEEVITNAGCEVGTVDATQGTNKYVLQRNESDLYFIKRLAARNGYVVTCTEGKIDFKKTQFSEQAVEVSGSQLISIDYGMSTMNVPQEVTVIGWDYVTKQRVEGTATSGDVEAIGALQNSVSAAGQIWADPSYISDVQVSSQEGAKQMAISELNRLARNFLRGRAVIQGNGQVHHGVKVKFSGHRKGFNVEGYVVSARHVMDPNGFHTELHFCANTVPE